MRSSPPALPVRIGPCEFGELGGRVTIRCPRELAHIPAEANRLARPDKTDLPALAGRAWPVLHRLGPLFLDAFQFRAIPAAASTLRAVELLRTAYISGGKKWPSSLRISFLRPAWREAANHVASTGGNERRTWEAATLLALRDS
jgi:hypothetical protein